MAGSILEEHVIKISHASDARELSKIRESAMKTATEIEKAFERAADGMGDGFEDAADDAEDAAKRTSEVWTGALRQIGARLTDFGISAAGAMASFVADTFESNRELDQFARTLNVSTSEMMALEKGFERARVPADNTREAIKTLRENLGELDRLGTGPARDSLGSLGLELEDFKGKTPTEQIKVLAQALQNVEDPMKRTSIAIELMGEDGQRLMPALLEGADGVQALTDAAREAGQVLDEDTIESMRTLDDALMEVKGQAEGVALSVLEAAVPAFESAGTEVSAWIEENQELIDQGVPAAIDMITQATLAMTTAVLAAANALRSLRDEFRQNDSGQAILETYDRIEARGGRLTEAQQRHREQIKRSAENTRRRSRELQGAGALAVPEGYESVNPSRRDESGDLLPLGSDMGARGPGDATISAAEKARIEAERRIERHNQKARAAKFESDEKSKTGGKKGGRRRGPSRDALDEAGLLFDEDFARIGGRFGATDKALEEARKAAAAAFDKGGNQAVARSAGLRKIGALTGTKNIEKQLTRDPLSELFGVENLPDVSPAEIAQDRAPQVLTATITNDFNITMDFAINGAARPDLIPDQVKDAFKAMFTEEVERSSRYAKGPFTR
ncbi:MAG: hypothetical protein VYA51_12780 [Planctomycetota bacterium]|nr:hypothetical protein [Planctomycetota bacterium]